MIDPKRLEPADRTGESILRASVDFQLIAPGHHFKLAVHRALDWN